MNKNEAKQLKILSQSTTVTMPEVYFTYSDNQVEMLAMSFIEGSNALNPLFLLKNSEQKQRFADSVISGMMELHSVTNNKFGPIDNPAYDSWLRYYDENILTPKLTGLKELSEKGKYNKKKYETLVKAAKFYRENVKEPEEAVLIHGDLNIMNIMADPETMALTAFIDPCGTMWADREYDLFQLRNMWGDAYGLYKKYKEKYPLDEYSDFRVAYYGAMHEASMRLGAGIAVTVWEDLDNMRLRKEMKKIKG